MFDGSDQFSATLKGYKGCSLLSLLGTDCRMHNGGKDLFAIEINA